jgi:hypothetical protein
MVKVAVAAYDPCAYAGSLIRVHATVFAAFPVLADRAPAPKDATGVAVVVEAVCEPVQDVAGASIEHV